MIMQLLRKCINCGEYTMKTENCPRCGGRVHTPHPAKFSLHDKYAKLRILRKKEEAKRIEDIDKRE